MQRPLKRKRLSSAITAALPQAYPLTRREQMLRQRISNPSVAWATRLCSIPRDAIGCVRIENTKLTRNDHCGDRIHSGEETTCIASFKVVSRSRKTCRRSEAE